MAGVLILGGGYGGAAAAVGLRERLGPEHELTLIDRRENFVFGFRKTWAFLGTSSLAEGQRPLKSLERLGIKVLHGAITRLDPTARSVEVDGRPLQADFIVVALGARPAPEAVPGFAEHGISFYSPESVEGAAARLAGFQGGRVAIVILGVPYPCPPAPFEAALLLREHFDSKGIQAELAVYSPLPMSLPVLGEAGCSAIEGRIAQSDIAFHPNRAPLRVEAGRIQFATARAEFDLLIGIPGHVCPAVVVSAGLAEQGKWVAPDPHTLETAHDGVYALGDVVSIPLADGKQLPKAGVFAEAQAQVVAERIASRINGQTPTATYHGAGYCFLEVGGGSAMLVRGDFLAVPRPMVELIGPAPEHLQAKHELEANRLAAWFGEWQADALDPVQ